MDAAMESDPSYDFLEKKGALEHQYSLRPGQLSDAVDDIPLLDDPPPAAAAAAAGPTGQVTDTETAAADAVTFRPGDKVTMYQCAQCKSTFTTLELCVNHQCTVSVSGADSGQTSSGHGDINLEEIQPVNYRWGQHDTEAFLQIIIDSVSNFSNPNVKRKFIWKTVCENMAEKGFSITQLQCENRWKTLKAMYRKSQSSGSTPPFFREMCDLAENYPALMADNALDAATRTVSEGQQLKTPWSREASLTMLALLKSRHQRYMDPSIKRRSLWAEISNDMKNINMDYTPEQCEGRMKTLLQAYKRAQVRFELTGESQESDCYYQVNELIGLIPNLAAGVAGRAAASAAAVGAGGGGGGVRPRGLLRRRRGLGRMSRQRGLLAWLDGWLQEQRRWDEGVLALLRSQHTERLRVLQEVRDELRSGGARIPDTRPAAAAAQQAGPPAPEPDQQDDDQIVTHVYIG